MGSLFETRWAVTTEAERNFLRARPATPRPASSAGAIAAEMGVDTKAPGVTRRSLINKGVIEAPQYGRLRFPIPGFAEFVRNQYGDPTPMPPGLRASFPDATREATKPSTPPRPGRTPTSRDQDREPGRER